MLIKLLLCLLLMVSACAMAQNGATPVSSQARRIHDSAIVIDTHADTPQRFVDQNFDLGSITPVTEGNFDLEKVRAGNLAAEFFSIWVDPTTSAGHFTHRALALIDSVYEQVARHPDRMVMAYSAEDIIRAHSGPHRKFAALMGVEGGHAIEGNIRILRDFYRLGVRYMTLTWSNTNEIGDSSGDQDDPKIEHHNGLTPFGKQVVREMNRLGMMVDISHVADKTFWDTLAETRAPVIASHSSARALTNAPRNMTDDMLRAVAKNGGVVDVNFFSGFLSEDYRKGMDGLRKDHDAAIEAFMTQQKAEGKPMSYMDVERVEREWSAKIPRPPLKLLIDHIDHVAKVAGIDHVGLGSDFDGVSGALPEGMDSVADLPKITQALLERGHSASDIKKILGGNVLRVFREVERISRESAAKRPAATASGKSQ